MRYRVCRPKNLGLQCRSNMVHERMSDPDKWTQEKGEPSANEQSKLSGCEMGQDEGQREGQKDIRLVGLLW